MIRSDDPMRRFESIMTRFVMQRVIMGVKSVRGDPRCGPTAVCFFAILHFLGT